MGLKMKVAVAALVVALLLLSLCENSQAQEPLVLDCAVTSSPALDAIDAPMAKTLALMERYRFTITPGGRHGLVSTPRGENLPAQVTESERFYQIDFENKRVVIDRMTAEFQVSLRGAKLFFGCGICNKLGERRF